MKQIGLMFAGAVALAVTSPALAKPGNGHGHGHGSGSDAAYGHGSHDAYGYGVGGCPPGLAKKNNGCMPPGQARKLNRGQRWQSSYGSLYAYNRIPYDVRRQYDLNGRYRYYYNDGYLYQVDPRTQLVSQVISALLH